MNSVYVHCTFGVKSPPQSRIMAIAVPGRPAASDIRRTRRSWVIQRARRFLSGDTAGVYCADWPN